MLSAETEDKTVVVTPGLQGGRSALAGHYPVVMSLLGMNTEAPGLLQWQVLDTVRHVCRLVHLGHKLQIADALPNCDCIWCA